MQELAGDDGDGEDDLAAYRALDILIARAKAQPDPVRWTRSHVRAALDRLDAIERTPAVKDEARRQLFALERRMLKVLLMKSTSSSVAAAFVYVVTLGLPLI